MPLRICVVAIEQERLNCGVAVEVAREINNKDRIMLEPP
jgi:hypothetical protein